MINNIQPRIIINLIIFKSFIKVQQFTDWSGFIEPWFKTIFEKYEQLISSDRSIQVTKTMESYITYLIFFPVDFLDTDFQFWRWNSSRGLLYSLRVYVGVNRSANDHSSLLPFSMKLSNHAGPIGEDSERSST